MKKDVAYYENDFSWCDWAAHCEEESMSKLPSINPAEFIASEKCQVANWEQLFGNHTSGSLYKSRNYLFKEFLAHFTECHELLELGCGYGSSVFALLPHLPDYVKIWAVDHSAEALRILQCHPDYSSERIECVQWSMTADIPVSPCPLAACVPDTVMLIFALSATLPEDHVRAVRNIKALLRRRGGRGLVLFRDYGMHDMTMYRHQRRLAELTFQRKDGTLCHYFTVEAVAALFESEGFVTVECRFATVINRNRKQQKAMHRVFVHAVFELSPS
eukprot:gene33184-40148_t